MAKPHDISQKMLNAAQVKALFEETCCLFGGRDGVPTSVAIELFGEDVVYRVIDDCKRGWDFNVLQFGGKCMTAFLYLSGFEYAATVANVAIASGSRPDLSLKRKAQKARETAQGSNLLEFSRISG